MDGTCVIKTEFLIIDEIRLLLMNILVKFQPDIHILMVMGGSIGVPVRSSWKVGKMMTINFRPRKPMPIPTDLSDFPLANSCGNGTYVFEISWMCVSRFPPRGPTNAAMESDNCISAVEEICCALDNYYIQIMNLQSPSFHMANHCRHQACILF
jgi:hypothetical protein